MAYKKSIINDLKKVLIEIEKSSGIKIQKAWLYGSYAHDTQHKWSDVDVALVANEFKGNEFDIVGLISRALIKFPDLLLQPITYHPSQFTPKNDPIVAEILKSGIEIRI